MGLLLLTAGAFVLGAGIAVRNVVVGTFRQSYCPPHLLGRVSSAAMATNQGTIAIGSALGGLLGSAIGIRPTLWVVTISLALTWLLLVLSPAAKTRDLTCHWTWPRTSQARTANSARRVPDPARNPAHTTCGSVRSRVLARFPWCTYGE
jgi:MFS family permease